MNVLEEAKFIIGRYDHYFESINNKCNLYLAINTLIIGAVMTGFPVLDKQKHFEGIMTYLPVAILLLSLIAILITLFITNPFLKNGSSSVLFFGEVSKSKRSDYVEIIKNISEGDITEDFIIQIHELARGLVSKFRKLRAVTVLLGFELALIIWFAIILIFKY